MHCTKLHPNRVLTPHEVDGLDCHMGPSCGTRDASKKVAKLPRPAHASCRVGVEQCLGIDDANCTMLNQGTCVAQEHPQAKQVDCDDTVVTTGKAVPNSFPMLLLLPWRREVVNRHHPPSVDGVDAPQL